MPEAAIKGSLWTCACPPPAARPAAEAPLVFRNPRQARALAQRGRDIP